MAGNYPHLTLSRPHPLNAIFIWGRAADEWQSAGRSQGVIEVAANVYHCTSRPPVVIPGYVGTERGQGTFGYPGPAIWTRELNLYNVARKNIWTTRGQGINTKTEMDDLLDLATREQWQSIVGVTLQAHALRAMLGTVQSLKQRGCARQIKVFPIWPTTVNLSQAVYGSQGSGPRRRIDWIDQEFERIPPYQAQGDLCTLAELRDYLHWLVG